MVRLAGGGPALVGPGLDGASLKVAKSRAIPQEGIHGGEGMQGHTDMEFSRCLSQAWTTKMTTD